MLAPTYKRTKVLLFSILVQKYQPDKSNQRRANQAKIMSQIMSHQVFRGVNNNINYCATSEKYPVAIFQ